MAVKLVVLYPRPKDVEAFETVYNRDHVPTSREEFLRQEINSFNVIIKDLIELDFCLLDDGVAA